LLIEHVLRQQALSVSSLGLAQADFRRRRGAKVKSTNLEAFSAGRCEGDLDGNIEERIFVSLLVFERYLKDLV
jgi:hypothetical protein